MNALAGLRIWSVICLQIPRASLVFHLAETYLIGYFTVFISGIKDR